MQELSRQNIAVHCTLHKTRVGSDCYPCLDSVVLYDFFFVQICVVSALGCRKWLIQVGRSHVLFSSNNIKVTILFLCYLVKSIMIYFTLSKIKMQKHLFFFLGPQSSFLGYNPQLVKFLLNSLSNIAYQIVDMTMQAV